MPKHTLTKEYDEALQEIADRLPVPEMKHRTPVPGWQLAQERPDLRGPQGEPIDVAKTYYIGSAQESVNHLRRLRKAYKKGGMPAVVRYLQPYEAFLATPEQIQQACVTLPYPSSN